MEHAFKSKDTSAVKSAIIGALQKDSLVSCRQSVSQLLDLLRVSEFGAKDKRDLLQFTLDHLAPRSISFEEQITGCAFALSELYESEEERFSFSSC